MLGLDYNDRVQKEMQNIPLSFYHLDATHPCYQMPLHWHRSFEMLRVLSGKISIVINDRTITAATGDIVFINQENIHGYQPTDCIYEVMDFDIEELLLHTALCKDILQLFTNSHINILPLSPEGSQELYAAVNKLFAYAAGSLVTNRLLVLGALFEFLGQIYICHHYTENDKSSVHTKIFKDLLEFIEHHYTEPLTLTDMAHASGMSPSHFSMLFRDFFHQTPMEYLNAYRIERACLMLLHTTLSITEIAYRSGFNDSAYFVKVFKKYKQVTPRKYRVGQKR